VLDSIYIGMSGLQGYSQGLRVIANNTANINTPGYKASTLQFTDMFYSNSNSGSGYGTMQVGYGLNTAGTVLNFSQGELRQTGNSLDLAVDGQGLFTLQDADGNLHYTRAGQFTFNADGDLVSRIDGSKVLGTSGGGDTSDISIAGLQTSAGKATSTVTFSGNLSSTATTTQTIQNVKVLDSLGIEHNLTLNCTSKGAGLWEIQVLEGTTVIGTTTNNIAFINQVIDPSKSSFSLTYKPTNGAADMNITFDFSKGVTSSASSNQSSIAFASQDGYLAGTLTGASFDATGTLVLAYSNGQTVKNLQLALGRFDSLDAVGTAGNNEFDATNPLAWHMGIAGAGGFGKVRAGMVELSNVDLSQEFSDLVIMQRGFQASSQVVSTANDMLQELFQMKSK
jgi:flagellar hook protein FlgE